jgi:peptidoglycan/xylan/chitin deacetylase (PgdA/CDA1 family)
VIVAYHAVSSVWRSPLAVPERTLRTQLDFFRKRGYIGLTFAESERRRQDGSLPPRSLVVTFDDGFRSILRAKPILDELGFPATVFVVTRFVDGRLPLDWPGLEAVGIASCDDRSSLEWSDLESLVADGWEIGSHTVHHPYLPDLDDADLERELVASRELITARLGGCDTLSYPYGLADARVAAAAGRAGYLGAATLTRAHTQDAPLLRPRFNLDSNDRGLRLRFVLSPPGLRLRRTTLLAWIDKGAGLPPWVPRRQDAWVREGPTSHA